MKRWQALVGLAGLFLLGVAGGALGAHLYYSRFVAPPHPPPFAGPRGGHHPAMELGLDAEQRRQVEAILAERRRRAEAVRREMGPALRAILEETEGEIRALLTPEQERRYGELRHRFERRTERFLEGHDHHRPRRWRRHRPPHDEPSAAEPETEDPSR